MNLEYYADLIFGKPVILPRAELNKILIPIAESIYTCPFRNRNRRKPNQVWKSTQCMALEYALDKIGIPINSTPFDKTDRYSYAYDNMSEFNHTFESKIHKKTSFSFKISDVSTMLKNIDIIDYLVTGNIEETKKSYIVDFKLLANAKTFKDYMKETEFPDAYSTHFYQHKLACRDKQAIIGVN